MRTSRHSANDRLAIACAGCLQGKFFGMEDIEIGFGEFDDKLIIKTNDQLRIREIFSDDAVRAVFQSLTDFTFGITHHHSSGTVHDKPFLELQIEVGITDPARLRESPANRSRQLC